MFIPASLTLDAKRSIRLAVGSAGFVQAHDILCQDQAWLPRVEEGKVTWRRTDMGGAIFQVKPGEGRCRAEWPKFYVKEYETLRSQFGPDGTYQVELRLSGDLGTFTVI